MKTKESDYYDGKLEGIREERARVLQAITEIEEHSHRTRTPIYQDKMFMYLRNVLYANHPPQAFRDKSNGE